MTTDTQAAAETHDDRNQSLSNHLTPDISRIRTEGHANTEFAGSLHHCLGDDAVDPQTGQEHRRRGEQQHEGHLESTLRHRIGHNVLHCSERGTASSGSSFRMIARMAADTSPGSEVVLTARAAWLKK